jgi:hypothetical protein
MVGKTTAVKCGAMRTSPLWFVFVIQRRSQAGTLYSIDPIHLLITINITEICPWAINHLHDWRLAALDLAD